MSDKKGLVVSVGKGGARQIIQQVAPTIKVQGQPISMSSGRAVDVVFVIDTTGSMSDKIQGLMETCRTFVDKLGNLNLAHRIAVVAFGDLTVPGDDIKLFNFSEDTQQVRTNLTIIPRYSGGGNEGESSLEALDRALTLPFRQSAVKVLILITDEPALQHQRTPESVTQTLQGREILTFVVSPPEHYYQEMARRSGGSWHQVSSATDFSGILDMFNKLAVRVSKVVADVYSIGNGSVTKYLQLKGRG